MDPITKRPAGITIIAILALVNGIVYFIQGLRILGFVAFGPGQAFTSTSMTGWSALALGALWIAAGTGFLTLRVWAWFFGVLVVGLSLIEAFFGNINGWQLGDMFFAMILPLVVLFYLNSDRVKASFDGLEN